MGSLSEPRYVIRSIIRRDTRGHAALPQKYFRSATIVVGNDERLRDSAAMLCAARCERREFAAGLTAISWCLPSGLYRRVATDDR